MCALRVVIIVLTAFCELFLLDPGITTFVGMNLGLFLSIAWIAYFLLAVREESPEQASDFLHLAGITIFLFDTVSLWPLFLVMAAWVEL
jgi:hypothetical protein